MNAVSWADLARITLFFVDIQSWLTVTLPMFFKSLFFSCQIWFTVMKQNDWNTPVSEYLDGLKNKSFSCLWLVFSHQSLAPWMRCWQLPQASSWASHQEVGSLTLSRAPGSSKWNLASTLPSQSSISRPAVSLMNLKSLMVGHQSW